jgi:hypothetical protein
LDPVASLVQPKLAVTAPPLTSCKLEFLTRAGGHTIESDTCRHGPLRNRAQTTPKKGNFEYMHVSRFAGAPVIKQIEVVGSTQYYTQNGLATPPWRRHPDIRLSILIHAHFVQKLVQLGSNQVIRTPLAQVPNENKNKKSPHVFSGAALVLLTPNPEKKTHASLTLSERSRHSFPAKSHSPHLT